MLQQRVELFQNMPVFGGVTEETLEFLVELASQINLAQGEYLFRENDAADAMYVLEAGRVAVIKTCKDKDYTIGVLGKGDCVGEMSLIDLGPRSASIVALSPTTVMRLTASDFYRLHKKDLAQFTLIQLNIAREVCRRLRITDQKLFEVQVRESFGSNEYMFHMT